MAIFLLDICQRWDRNSFLFYFIEWNYPIPHSDITPEYRL
jgi:hypothetical protein